MRIVVDLQGAQTGSRIRGVGRYSLSLAKAMVSESRGHEIILALSGLFPDSIEPIRAEFEALVPPSRIRVWNAPGPVREADPENGWRRSAGEKLRSAFLASLEPDLVLVSSLFEGLVDDALTSIPSTDMPYATAVVLYDLIPFIHRDLYGSSPTVSSWYQRKIVSLRRAELWLAISESSRQEGMEHLGMSPDRVVNISTAADTRFRPLTVSIEQDRNVRERYRLTRPFLMYTGGIDPRKNIEGLIRAFASIPKDLCRAYQLAIVCSIQPEDRTRLRRLVRKAGLDEDAVVITGFVPDEDLLLLYNLCQLFVFPSWHEGFGLPALEAMSCGTPTIGSNCTSIPEVIGREDALFDPRNERDIAAKIVEVLRDDKFRGMLREHGPRHARTYSWETTAERALMACERVSAEYHAQKRALSRPLSPPPRLAYVSPLPPEKTGIADYSADLLPELARFYDIELVTDQAQVSGDSAPVGFPLRSTSWFNAHADRYDRILYHFGNSEFHRQMFALLAKHPGTVVLHDFYLSGVILHMEIHGLSRNQWARSLYASHGYPSVRARFHALDPEELTWTYPANLDVLQRARGIIVHSQQPIDLAGRFYGPGMAEEWRVIPLLRVPPGRPDRAACRAALGFSSEDFVVCSFGMLGPIKMNHRLLDAWLASALAGNRRCYLIFVGENDAGKYGAGMIEAISASGLGKRIRITGRVSREDFQLYLDVADVAVQLRTLSRGETSAAVLDCMAHGVATIVNAHGSMAYLPDDCVLTVPDEFGDKDITEALERLWRDDRLRDQLGARARDRIRADHDPRHIAEEYHSAIEHFAANAPVSRRLRLSAAVASLDGGPAAAKDWVDLAEAIAMNHPASEPQRQLLVDVSVLVQRDAKSGIQRVVRGVLDKLLSDPPAGYRIEPVYTTPWTPYRYARRFTLRLLDCPDDTLEDDVVLTRPGDIFLGLDLVPLWVPQKKTWFQSLRDRGTTVLFVVYDLLPIVRKDCFAPAAFEQHSNWMRTVAEHADGAICISRSVADELQRWLDAQKIRRQRAFHIGWFHLGADVEPGAPTQGLAEGFLRDLDKLRSTKAILMVGTIEPRKAYPQALAAFEMLWAQDIQASLVIVGKQGWTVEALIERIRSHPELGKRLFWYGGVSDESLTRLYQASAGLLMASEGEGFGLPIIEAARHKVPILARDLPVFREVAGEHASYFTGSSPAELAEALKFWLSALSDGTAPRPDNMPWLTWAQSTGQLTRLVAGKEWPMVWKPAP